MSDTIIQLTPTMHFRWLKETKEREARPDDAFYVPPPSRIYQTLTLQQAYQGSDGSTRWIDVPTTDSTGGRR